MFCCLPNLIENITHPQGTPEIQKLHVYGCYFIFRVKRIRKDNI